MTLEAVYAGLGERHEEGEEHAESPPAEAEAAAAPPAPSPDGEWGSVTLARGEFTAIESNLVFQGPMAHEPHELKSVFLGNCDKKVHNVEMVGTCDCLICDGRRRLWRCRLFVIMCSILRNIR